MSKIILFSDLHAHAWPEFAGVTSYRGLAVNTRIKDAVDVLTHVRRHVEQIDAEAVIFAGDLFHRKRLIDVSVFNLIAHEVWRMARHTDVYLMAGNHDLARKGPWSSEHALFALGGKRGVHIIDRPTMVGTLGLVPYADERDTLLEGIDALGGEPEAYVMHLGVNGAVTGAVEHQPREPVEMKDLPFVPIYAGHYHLPQEVTRDRGSSVVYVGAPLEMIRGEGSRLERGFLTLDVDEPASYERVVHRGPRFKSVQDFTPGTHVKNAKGNFLDVTYDPTKTDIGAVSQALLELRPRSWSAVPVERTATRKTRMHLSGKSGKMPSLHALCDRYAKEYAGPELDSTRLKNIAREALDAAMEGKT